MARFLIVEKQKDIPIPPEVMKQALPAVFGYLKQLQAQGKFEALFGFATRPGGCVIINVDSHAELQRIATSYPMSPFVTWEAHPLTTIEESEKAVQEMLSRLP